jgi:phenylpropionate dioxygenase-like ring-hydroxylating dioxygenase large terminal subunit
MAAKDPQGRAYGRPQGQPDEELVRCGPGTPGGELLRRYWQPVSLSADATTRPRLVKLLGEELILFRDGSGRPGLLYPRCAHRGTSLLYGKVEAHGVRCCYHGWLFDAEGHCLEMPCEPESRANERIRQPWYPVVEKFGLVFAYLGPAGRQPDFPVFSIADGLGEHEELKAVERLSGPNGVYPKVAARADYNWWNIFDNYMDPFHVVITHYAINGPQFTESLGILPKVEFEFTPDGVRSIQRRTLPDGRVHQRVSQVILPNMHCTPGVSDEDFTMSGLGWIVPQDDTSFRMFRLFRVNRAKPVTQFDNYASVAMLRDDWGPRHGKPLREWSLEDHQDWQTDYVTQKGQGDISLHSEEHLTRSDAGTAMMRRLFKKQARIVAGGGNPIGSSPGTSYRVEVRAGNGLFDAASGECIAGYDGRAPKAVLPA